MHIRLYTHLPICSSYHKVQYFFNYSIKCHYSPSLLHVNNKGKIVSETENYNIAQSMQSEKTSLKLAHYIMLIKRLNRTNLP